uniref:Uncharacterized protein n=1 Tax=Sphaerodactylus townsendi TaxID=933632 RepID=A0ACB8E6M7_9SAUR
MNKTRAPHGSCPEEGKVSEGDSLSCTSPVSYTNRSPAGKVDDVNLSSGHRPPQLHGLLSTDRGHASPSIAFWGVSVGDSVSHGIRASGESLVIYRGCESIKIKERMLQMAVVTYSRLVTCILVVFDL